MARPLLWMALAALCFSLAFAQRGLGPDPAPEDKQGSPRLKHSQIEAILKEDREKSIEDARQIARLAGELQAELEKNDKAVFSLAALRKTEELEKLVKRVRGRFRRY